eukprot:4905-Heterococcus_DN1.PRE.2
MQLQLGHEGKLQTDCASCNDAANELEGRKYTAEGGTGLQRTFSVYRYTYCMTFSELQAIRDCCSLYKQRYYWQSYPIHAVHTSQRSSGIRVTCLLIRAATPRACTLSATITAAVLLVCIAVSVERETCISTLSSTFVMLCAIATYAHNSFNTATITHIGRAC